MNLENAPKEQEFWLNNGKSLKNIIELNRELQTMQQQTFIHHVNEKKNDFANWIEHTLKDKKLATLIGTTKNQQRMQAIIERQIQKETIDKITKNDTNQKTKYNNTWEGMTILPPEFLHEPDKQTKQKTTKIPEQTKQEYKIIKTKKITEHGTPYIHIHEVNKKHHSGTLLISHTILGIVAGIALAMLVYALT